MTNKSFSEFIRTASDDEKRAVYEQAMKKATEEQNKVLEEYMEQLEQEPKTLEPTLDDIFSEQNKRKLFKNKSAMLDYLSMVSVAAGQFRQGYGKDGQLVWELVYISEQED